MSKSCWSISWDHQYRVYAVYLRMTFGGDLELLSCCCDTSGQRTLGDRLTSILEKIQVGEEDYLVLGGYMPECVIVERYFPPLEGRELEEAITFSSESCFPVARKKLKFTYNVLEKRRDGQQRVRIMAALDKQLDKIFREMRKAIDSVIWLLATILYFVISFGTMAWYITWVIWLIAPCVQTIVHLVMEQERK